jgi:hypothetical protein
MKQHYENFRALKDDTTAPAPPPARRARGGRTEMRVAGNPDVFKEAEGEEPYDKGDLKPGTRGRRRAPRARSEKAKSLGTMSGATPKHRADKQARGGRKKLASGGGSSLFGNPWISPVAITHGHGAPNPPPAPQDQSAQQIASLSNAMKNSGLSGSGASNKSQDLGYAVYSDGTPIGIRGIAPFAGSDQDISASKRGGRVREHASRTKGPIES